MAASIAAQEGSANSAANVVAPAAASDSTSTPRTLPPVADDVEDELDDIFIPSEDDDEWDASAASTLTKSYNRQRQLNNNAAAAAPAPRSNAQHRPTANTQTSVDDQITALARHAAKIKLDDTQGTGGGGGGRGGGDRDKADRATSEQVLDQRTRMVLLQMINRGIVSEVHGAVSTGKEANVYGAVVEDADAPGGVAHRAIKVYKTAILVFKDRERYIAGEHRFRASFDKGNNRKMVKLWAEKEYRNLRRIHAAGIPCPEPIALKLHVMVMGFLGDRRGWAYPRLRDAVLEGDVDRQWRALYVQLLGIMRRMYQVCRLVHADLSEYNILYHAGRLYVIDVSQSVEPDHPRSLEFLRMDIKNVGDFFRRQGVDTLVDRVVFDFVTAPEGATDPEGTEAVLERLYAEREARREAGGQDEDAREHAEDEVDTEVFRNQYIPQTLEQVYDIEKDARRIGDGHGGELVYKGLLADSVVRKAGGESEGEDSEDDGSDEGSEDGSGKERGGEDGEDGDEFDKGRPRGRKFEPKDEKKAHKQAVKEAKREKRKDKMPKYVKKKLVTNSSSRKGK